MGPTQFTLALGRARFPPSSRACICVHDGCGSSFTQGRAPQRWHRQPGQYTNHRAGLPPEPLLFRLRMRRPVRSEPRGDRGPVIPDLHTVQVYRDRASIQFFIDNAAMGVNIVTHDVCASPFASQLVNTVGCHMTSRHQNRVGAHRSWRIHHEIRVLGSLQGTRNGHVLTQHLPEIC